MSNTNNKINKSFENDLVLWKNISGNFSDIVAESNVHNHFEWHVTITRDNYHWHFMVFWNERCPIEQPKILSLFNQRCLVSSPYFRENWVVLENLKLYTVTSVLLGMRKIVSTVDVTNVDRNLFNNCRCLYCYFGAQSKKTESLSNSSVENSSVASLTISHASHLSINISNNQEELIEIEPKKEKKSSITPPIVTKDNIKKSSVNHVPVPEKSKIHSTQPSSKSKLIEDNNLVRKDIIVNNKDVSSNKPRTKSWSNAVSKHTNKTNKMAVRYLDVDDNGRLVWKWTLGRRS